MKLPIKCIFEWQPQWDDGTRGYGISRPHVLPPLNQSGFTVRVTALRIRWLEDGEWKSESFSDVSEEIIEFELPVLNTLTLKGVSLGSLKSLHNRSLIFLNSRFPQDWQ